MSKVLDLVLKSNLDLVSIAYQDLLDWENEITDERMIEEIEYKLNCAIDDYNGGCDDSYTPKDFKKTRNFINRLKKERNK